jgi:hypothetical protein
LFSQPRTTQNQRTVISTEAAHAFVSSEAEKSASLPRQYLGHCRVFAFAVVFAYPESPKPLIPLSLQPMQFIFRIFRPKIACQAPKRPNSIKRKEIELAR